MALIVGIALIVIIVVGGVLCYANRDKLIKVGATTMVQQITAQMRQEPQPGVDTALVGRVSHAFVEKVDAGEPDFEKLAMFLQSIQNVPNDKVLDSTEAVDMVAGMVDLYPELGELAQPEPVPDTVVTDSVTAEQ